MSRTPTFKTDQYPYHVTFRTNNRLPFPGELRDIWRIFEDELSVISTKFTFKIHAFTLMSNHAHLVIFTPNSNIDSGMCWLLRETSKRINTLNNSENHIYGARYKWGVIIDDRYYFNCIRYVFQNPIRAKIVKRVEDYPFTSLLAQTGAGNLKFSTFCKIDLLKESFEWINQANEIPDDLLKMGLKKRFFKLPVVRANRRK